MLKKIKWFELIIYLLFLILLIFLIKIIWLDGYIYKKKIDTLTNIYVYGDSPPRGRIYDKNYKLLVDNDRVLEITYQNVSNKSPLEEIELAYSILPYLKLDYDKVKINHLKELYYYKNYSELEKRLTKNEKNSLLTKNDLKNIILDRITNEDLDELSLDDKKVAYLYYLMHNDYSYKKKVIKKEASMEEYTYFSLNDIDGFSVSTSFKRIYPYGDLFKGILGKVGSITKENKDEYLSKGYSINDIVGLSNIELQYEDILKGKKAVYKKVSNNKLELVSEEEKGNDIVLSIDIDLIKDISDIIDKYLLKSKGEKNTTYLNKTYVVIQEPNTGSIEAIVGRKIDKVNNDYLFYDISSYALTDAMTPGSVVKGASLIVGFNNEAIKIGDKFTDECVKLYNLPRKCSSARYGLINDIKALAISSNVYQFKTALKVAGIKYHYNMKTDIPKEAFDTYKNTFKEFGLGVKTEIDLPIESKGYSGNKYTPDLYLNYSIGQYDTYTPIQLSQYITTIASNGNRIKPRLLKEVYKNYDDNILLERIKPTILNKVTTKDEYLSRVQVGFRSVMKDGLGKNVMGKLVEAAGKTGTSESFLDTNNDGIIDTETISSSFVGYAPYDNPKMTITVTSPDVSTNGSYVTYMNRLITREISNTYFTKYN